VSVGGEEASGSDRQLEISNTETSGIKVVPEGFIFSYDAFASPKTRCPTASRLMGEPFGLTVTNWLIANSWSQDNNQPSDIICRRLLLLTEVIAAAPHSRLLLHAELQGNRRLPQFLLSIPAKRDCRSKAKHLSRRQTAESC
jgi:hypothetical protein